MASGGRCRRKDVAEGGPHLAPPLVLRQHPDEHRWELPVLLAVDQELGEGAGRGVGPVRADQVARSNREQQDCGALG